MPLSRIQPDRYPSLLSAKVAAFNATFAGLNLPSPEVFASPPREFRLRAEFRIWHSGERIDYAMFSPNAPKTPVPLDDFPIASATIRQKMRPLRDAIQAVPALVRGLFQIDFLSTLSGDLLVTLLYHRALDDAWEAAARDLAARLNIALIGRSRKQKCVLERDYVIEEFEVAGRRLRYQQIEGGFSQPNGDTNRAMLGWACRQAAPLGGDLLELYCGNGNFTIALAPLFGRVLATEMSKTSVRAAQYNLAANGLDNVALARLSSEEMSSALAGERPFRRLAAIPLAEYRFSTLFVDPPRSGLDEATLNMAAGFEHVLYVSCNPQTLRQNLEAMIGTHRVAAAAVFDQFPYTDHLEVGLLLTRR